MFWISLEVFIFYDRNGIGYEYSTVKNKIIKKFFWTDSIACG